MNNILSKKEYWNNNYTSKVFLPVKVEVNSIDLFSLDALFKKYLSVNKKNNFIELGCAPGGWMYYFDHYFNLSVSGVDYAEDGIKMTQENMNMLEIEASVYNSDVFQYSSDEKYNIVFSAGLIEHFYGEKLREIIKKHFELAKVGGYVVIIIPNLKGWNYLYQRLINRKNLDIHNLEIMDLDFFEKNVNNTKAEKIFLDYAGKINFGLYSGNIFFGYLHTAIQMIINILFFKFGIRFKDNKKTSPYILAIYKVLEN